MRLRLAFPILGLASLVACSALGPAEQRINRATIPQVGVAQTAPGNVSPARDDGFQVLVHFEGKPTASGYRVAFALSDVAKLVVGIFERSTDASTVPALGYFNNNGAGISATNPLSSSEFTALQGALGTGVSVGTADKTASRRYLFRTINSPATTTPATVSLTNFPGVSATAPVHAYNLLVCAIDSYAQLVGYTEQDLTAAIQSAGTVSMTCNLNYGNLGAITVASTASDTNMDPATDLDSLLIGTYDDGATPRLGWINDGASNVAFSGSQAWFTALKDWLKSQGIAAANVTDNRRYLIRQYLATVSTGTRTTTHANVPVGSGYRGFMMAVRNSSVDAGHLLSASTTVTAGATASISFGSFTTGWVETFAGNGTTAYLEGTGTGAQMNNPAGVFVDSAGTVYFTDNGNYRIRKLTSGGVSSFIAGSGAVGSANGNGSAAAFSSPRGIVKDSAGNLYVADSSNNCIRKINGAADVTTFAGLCGSNGNVDGTGTGARLGSPYALAIDASDNLIVSDTFFCNIRKITPAGVVTTLAGDTSGTATCGFVNAATSSARFSGPAGVAVDSAGTVFVGDSTNNAVRKVTAAGVVSTYAGDATSGLVDANGTAARFSSPRGVALDASGSLYVGDLYNHRIRKIKTNQDVLTVAGTGATGAFADGDLSTARFNQPEAIAIDSNRVVIIADFANHRIRKLR